jgi:hypothetical protein
MNKTGGGDFVELHFNFEVVLRKGTLLSVKYSG